MPHVARVAVLTAAVVAPVLFAAGGTAVAAPATHHHRATVTVHATGKRHVSVTATTRPGVARLTNTGAQPIFLVAPRHGAGKVTLAHDLNADTAGELLRSFTVADVLPAKATTYLRLARGTYYLADSDRDEFTAASIASLRVTGETVNAAVPRARVIAVTSHGTLTGPTSIATSSELQVSNHSAHLQELFLAPVARATTAAELDAFLAEPGLDTLYSVVARAPTFLAMLSPRARATSTHRSAAGRYLLLTVAVTSHSGEPHLGAGRVRLVTVT